MQVNVRNFGSVVVVVVGSPTLHAWQPLSPLSLAKQYFAKINMHGIELGVPFQIGLRNRRSTHFTGLASVQN